jgi:cytochrome P450
MPTPEQTPTLFPGFRPFPGQPAFFDSQRGVWLVFRYAEVQRVLSDHSTFSNDRGGLDPAQPQSANRSDGVTLISMDPPRHRLYRSLVTQAFTPRTVAQLEPRIAQIVHNLLDAVVDRGEMDVIDDFSYLLSITVIAEMLGVPATDQEQFKQWTADFFEITTPAAAQAQRELNAYFGNIFAQHRAVPQDDLISALLNAEVDGQHMTEAEMSNFCSLLLLAGNDTTRNLIANGILCFDTFPDAMMELSINPALIPSAIEEVLRYLPSVHTAPRVAAIDTTLDGQQVKARQWVMPMLASANRDETQFPASDVFDIHRSPNRHLTFGYGVHFCLGAPLARLESKIALNAIFERLTDIQRVRTVPLVAVTSPIVYGMEHLPITFKSKTHFK